MIHHFRPAQRVTSIAALALKRLNYADLVTLLDPQEGVDVHPDGSVTINEMPDGGPPMTYGGPGDPNTWWVLVDNLGGMTVTSLDPYDNPELIPAERA